VPTLSLAIVAAFAFTIVGQAIGLSLIPATRGFTAIWPTIACILSFVSSFAVFARLVNNGVQLSMLTPIITVTLQLVVLVIGITVYHESASLARIGLLLGATVMIAAATQL
jgi:small multidrug resistance pump